MPLWGSFNWLASQRHFTLIIMRTSRREFSSNYSKILELFQHIRSPTRLGKTEPNLKQDKSSDMIWNLCLVQILQFASGAFVNNALLIFFPFVLQVTLNFRPGILMKQLLIIHLIFWYNVIFHHWLVVTINLCWTLRVYTKPSKIVPKWF